MSTARWTKFRLSVPITFDSTTNLAPEPSARLGWRQEPGRCVPVRAALSGSASLFPSYPMNGGSQ